MKIKFILSVVFILAQSVTSIAQQEQKPDSLLQVLQGQKEDTNKLKTLSELSKWYSLRRKYEPSNKYAEETIRLAANLNSKIGLALAYTSLGHNSIHTGNFVDGLKYHQASLKVSEETGNKKGIANAYNNIGYTHSEEGNKTDAVKYFEIAARLAEQAGDKRGAALYYHNLGFTYYTPLSNFAESIKAEMNSLRLNLEINNKRGVAARYVDLGNNYESLGNYSESIKNYFTALRIFEEVGEKRDAGVCYNNIGLIYFNQGNAAEALKYYLISLRIAEEVKSRSLLSLNYTNIGEAHRAMGNLEESMQSHLKALKMTEEDKFHYGTAYSHLNIGATYSIQGNYDEALKSYFSSLNIFKKIEENEGMAKVYIEIGETYLKLKNYPEAKRYFTDALSAARAFGGKRIIRDAYENLARVDSANANWESAFQYDRLTQAYRDSLNNQENTNKITEARLQYEFSKREDSLKYGQVLTDEQLKQKTLLSIQQAQAIQLKEKELALANNEKSIQQLQLQKNQADFSTQKAETEKKENQLEVLNKQSEIQSIELKKQRQIKSYLLAGLGLFVVLSFFIYRNYRTRQQLKLQMLRNKIASDLHDDVGSTLSSISIFSQMAQQQSKEVIPLLETIEESSHKMLDAMADIVWTIKPENDQFEKIISRMRSFAYELLGAKKIDFEFVADDDVAKMKLPMEVRKNLYLIFKEATNNMVKYAGADKAMFAIKGEKNNLTMLIRDNGKGFDTRQPHQGNGLKNMKKRAEEIKGNLTIDSLPGSGTTIQLSVAV